MSTEAVPSSILGGTTRAGNKRPALDCIKTIGTKSAQDFGGGQRVERDSGLLTTKTPDVTMANDDLSYSRSAR